MGRISPYVNKIQLTFIYSAIQCYSWWCIGQHDGLQSNRLQVRASPGAITFFFNFQLSILCAVHICRFSNPGYSGFFFQILKFLEFLKYFLETSKHRKCNNWIMLSSVYWPSLNFIYQISFIFVICYLLIIKYKLKNEKFQKFEDLKKKIRNNQDSNLETLIQLPIT